VERNWQLKTELLGEKPVPVPLCPPPMPHGMSRDRIWASEVGDRRLTAWAMPRPNRPLRKTRPSYTYNIKTYIKKEVGWCEGRYIQTFSVYAFYLGVSSSNVYPETSYLCIRCTLFSSVRQINAEIVPQSRPQPLSYTSLKSNSRRGRKLAKSDSYVHYVRPPAWNSYSHTGGTFVKFYIWVFFENLLRKIRFH
jgi:hypothetical protein